MKSRLLFLCFLWLFAVPQECDAAAHSSKSLQTFLSQGEKGDYIVAESGKLFTLIHIRAIVAHKKIVLEEISAPIKNLPKKSWGAWVQEKAPGHSSWSILEIDLESGKILDCYSFSKNAHIQISQKESLFATLLSLPLKPVQLQERRRIGPAPLPGESDFRKLWHPPLIFEGKPVANAEFNVFQTHWPNDDSELTGRQVTLYFDQKMRVPLPLWVDVETSHITFHFHVIDSGKYLTCKSETRPFHRE